MATVQSTTGYTDNTPKHYLVNSGVVYKNLTFNNTTDVFEGTLVGATSGGVTFTIENTYRYPEVDGTGIVQGMVKGNVILESAKAMIVANLKETTSAILGLSINGTIADALETEAPTGYKKITSKRYVESVDYLTNVAIVGKLGGTGEPVIFIIDNPLVTGGVEIATEENGEAVLELTFEAHATSTQLLADAFPWRMYFPSVV